MLGQQIEGGKVQSSREYAVGARPSSVKSRNKNKKKKKLIRNIQKNKKLKREV